MVLKEETLRFIQILNQLPERDYLASVIEHGTAPTIRGKKPSCLITFTKCRRNLYRLWKSYKQEIIQELQLSYIELNDTSDSVRVLFYNPLLLEKCIHSKENRDFLNKLGYRNAITLDEYLGVLKRKFQYICPHEIGIFLGIPIQDVLGFIHHKGNNSIICRYWKVYHNPDKAKVLFNTYDTAKEEAREAIRNKLAQ